jgi:tetratricopeptide (TPR) repeat protein
MPQPKIFVNMIVRDESPIIERCLSALNPHVEGFVIADTGSVDDTKAKIRDLLGPKAIVVDHEWENFGANRTRAIHEATQRMGPVDNAYLLVIDADDEIHFDEDFAWPEDGAHVYSIEHRMGTHTWWRPQLFRANLPWRYEGVVHEFPTCGGKATNTGKVGKCFVEIHHDGARRRTMGTEEKYLQDAKMLEDSLDRDPDDSRATFYLGQSYRDAGHIEDAINAYERRYKMTGGFDEERWYSKYQIGLLRLRQQRTREAILHLRQAFKMRPWRSEPLLAMARAYRMQRQWIDAHMHAATAVTLERPNRELLFVEADAYTWRPLDELAVACAALGRKDQAAAFNRELLRYPNLPEDARIRIERNLDSCLPFPLRLWEEDVADELQDQCEDLRDRHQALHAAYVEKVSTEAMALSLETAAFAIALAEQLDNPTTLDTGSGFSTAVLRSEGLSNVAVDDSSEWLERTREFLSDHELRCDELYLWQNHGENPVPDGPFDVVIHDLGNMNTRGMTLPDVWDRVAPGGWLILDDMHMAPYRNKVTAFFRRVDAEVYDCSEFTTDHFGRFAWAARKPNAS